MDDRWAVRHPIPMRHESGPVPSMWCYDPASPLSVSILFPWGVRWDFARGLLRISQSGVAGTHDVQVWHLGGRIALRLRNGDEEAWLKAPAAKVRRFLDATYAWVPAGEEPAHVDVDAVLARILEEADRC